MVIDPSVWENFGKRFAISFDPFWPDENQSSPGNRTDAGDRAGRRKSENIFWSSPLCVIPGFIERVGFAQLFLSDPLD